MEDLHRVMQMSVDLKKESPVFKETVYIPERHFTFLVAVMDDEDKQLFVSENDVGELNGFIYGGIGTFFWNDDKFAEDYTIYVVPADRGTRTGYKLIHAFEEWAKTRGATRIFLGSNVGINTEGFGKFLERLGYDNSGLVMSKGL